MSKLRVKEIAHSNNTQAISIDSSGRVTTPARPAFMIRNTSNQAMTDSGWRTVNLNGTKYTDVGNNVHTNGYFTCPVDGIYHFDCRMRVDGIGSSYVIMCLSDLTTGSSPATGASTQLYGSTYHIDGTPPSNYITMMTSITIELDANTNVMPWLYSADTSITISTVSSFSGFLVG